MTQPTTVNMTFDTSLVDLNASFSTTESDTSDGFTSTNPVPSASTSNVKTPTPPRQDQQQYQSQDKTPKASQESPVTNTPMSTMLPPPIPTPSSSNNKPSTPVQHIPTQAAYDQWATVYDSDGNMLQAVDDLELATLLPDVLSRVVASLQEDNSVTSPKTINIIDLGCGTGRNTAKLLCYNNWPSDWHINITALDFSQGMLDVAARKLSQIREQQQHQKQQKSPPPNPNITLHLEHCNPFPSRATTDSSPLSSISPANITNLILSTLVLEHIPLPSFFATVSSLLSPSGGLALITNMHSDMGRVTQAGFVDGQTGRKVRAGHSFAHSVQETVEEARKWGLEVLWVRERAVERGDVDVGGGGGVGGIGKRGEKWIGWKVWYGCLFRRVG